MCERAEGSRQKLAMNIKVTEQSRHTEMGYKMGPRLREYHLLTPSGSEREFTQPRAHLIAQLCSV